MKYLMFFITITCFSQNLKILDQNTKNPISFAIVKVDTIGFYTNQAGFLDLSHISFDSLSISHLNYKTLKLKSDLSSDTLYLEPKIDMLDEVLIIDYNNLKSKKLNRPRKYFNSIIKNNVEVITCLCPNSNKIIGSFIIQFNFELSKNQNLTDKIKLKNKAVSFRLNFYTNINQKPQDYLKSIVYDSISLNDMIENKNYAFNLNFQHDPLKIKEKGFCFGLEHLGFQNVSGTNDNFFISIENSFNKSKYFDAKTLTNYPLSGRGFISAKERDPKGFQSLNLKENPVLIPEMLILKL